MHSWLKVILVTSLLSLGACSEQKNPDLYNPSEISLRIYDSVMVYVRIGKVASQDDFNAERDRFARMLADSMQSAGLDSTEKFTRAKVLFWSGEKEEAEKIFQELTLAEDEISRNSRIQLINMKIESGEWDFAEIMMRDYREKFPPDPEAPVSLRLCVDDLAGRYNNNDQPEDAIGVILEEINNQPLNYPYSSFSLVGELEPLMIETGRVPELKKLVVSIRENLDKSLQVHLALPVPPDSMAEEHDELTASFKSNIDSMDMLLARLSVIGHRAPDIGVLNVFNADSTFMLDHCRGKITVMDFWTTWCIACVIGYAELGELYSHYGEDDLAVIGVTSFQGIIYDVDSGEREGSKEEPVSQDKERKYIEGYIKKHGMSWPCIISDRPAKDPRYNINGFPTYVILDRDGIVRYMHMGVGKQRQMRRIIDLLLSGQEPK